MKKKIKWIGGLGVFLVALAISVAYMFYGKIFAVNTVFHEDEKYLLVPESALFTKWLQLEENADIFRDTDVLRYTASLKKFSTLKPGRYAIKRGMDSNSIINMLRRGEQSPVKIRIDDVKTLEALAGKMGRNFRSDSLSFISTFGNEADYPADGYNKVTVACMIKPNTYEFYWTMTPEQFLSKMAEYNKRYWSEERIEKARLVSLTPIEATILASIVKAETAKVEEAPRIAGLYLNRLRINKPLESDPTAVFGAGLDHVSRVTEEISHSSEYNTYKRSGLPPGPINFPEEVYIEAVLNPEKNNFLYMCAQPGGSRLHNFTQSYDQHLVNRRQYTKWLDTQGITK